MKLKLGRNYVHNNNQGDKDFFEPLMLIGEGPGKFIIWWSRPTAKIRYRVLLDMDSPPQEINLSAENKDQARKLAREYYEAGKFN